MRYYQTVAECFARPYDRESENPDLVGYVERVPEGYVFDLWGHTYRRQNTFSAGDIVLYIEESRRFYCGEDGSLLIEGKVVSRPFRGLNFAKIETADGIVGTTYHAEGDIGGYIGESFYKKMKKHDGVRFTPIAVMLRL